MFLTPFRGGSVNPKLDDNDANLFREAVRDVKPLAYDAPVAEPAIGDDSAEDGCEERGGRVSAVDE